MDKCYFMSLIRDFEGNHDFILGYFFIKKEIFWSISLVSVRLSPFRFFVAFCFWCWLILFWSRSFHEFILVLFHSFLYILLYIILFHLNVSFVVVVLRDVFVHLRKMILLKWNGTHWAINAINRYEHDARTQQKKKKKKTVI